METKNETDIKIVKMTTVHAKAIAAWTYDGAYSFYNHNESFANDCMDGMHFAFVDNDGQLLGYLCFGPEAQIPTAAADVYDDGFLDIGLHIRPDLTGKGLGNVFLKACLNFVQGRGMGYRATIAAFNARAIALCVGAGFCVEGEVLHRDSGQKFVIVKRADKGPIAQTR